MKRSVIAAIAAVALILGAAVGVLAARLGQQAATGGALAGVAEARGLTGEQAEAALKTFVPPGSYDEYYIFSSGGHSGQVLVYGVPSMRLLKEIPVFTPDAWQGYGYGTEQGLKVLAEGSDPDKNAAPVAWGDTHHPALSETEGDYDGRWLYINDRANGRIAMIDLADFKTKQIVDIPNSSTSHGGVFVTPNTEYAHISSMTPMPWSDGGYADLDEYQEAYRGVSSWMAIDPDTGRIDLGRSFQIELPPYTQDLADAGKLTSYGWAFINSYNTEMAVGTAEGGEPLEIGAIENDYDFLHIINWKKAEEVVAAGDYVERDGMRVIPLETAIEEGILYFAPEPRNPHGVDVSPTGDYIVVSGKLDPNATVFDFELIQKAIENEDFQGTDPYGVPILNLDSVVAAQVELGVGPLHTQFDDEGHAYTSIFVDSAVAEWTLGPKAGVPEGEAFKLVDKIPVQYNIGHLVAAEGDTVAPDGRYLVALNKWSIDRYEPVGTLKPQNFQLIDLESDPLQILYDVPVPNAEPHYAQMIEADKLVHRLEVYEPGTDPLTMSKSGFATLSPDDARIERNGKVVDVYMTAMRSHFTPDIIRVKEGDRVNLHITNIEATPDATHGFAIPQYNIHASLDPGEVVSITFEAKKSGSFAFYCSEFCSALHLEMQGWLLVEPE